MESQYTDARLEKTALILLERVRDVYGYISEDALSRLADQFGIPPVDLYSTATFYTALPMRPPGKHLIRVCKSVPCYIKKNQPVIAAIERELGVGVGQTSSDGLFTLVAVNCIGACDEAPAMMVDDNLFGNVIPETVGDILANYR